jgi:hypothetical protein
VEGTSPLHTNEPSLTTTTTKQENKTKRRNLHNKDSEQGYPRTLKTKINKENK